MEHPIKNLTNLEQKVISSIARQCEDYCASIEAINEQTGLAIPMIKGVIGSLVKKGFVYTEGREVVELGKKQDIFLLIGEVVVCFDDENEELNEIELELFNDLKKWRLDEA